MRMRSSRVEFHEIIIRSGSTGVGFGAVFLFCVLAAVTWTHAETLTIATPEVDVSAARAQAAGSKTEANGMISTGKVVFEKLLPGESYDVTLTQPDQKQLRLIDLSWYADLPPADTEPGPLKDEDRAAIHDILTNIKAFTNKNTLLTLVGNADRAVALVELIRDTDFHARKADEIIWRVEVWYFEYQAGGWAKVQQQNRIIERQRFKSTAAFEAYRKPLTWIGIEKGLRIEKGKDATVNLPEPKAR